MIENEAEADINNWLINYVSEVTKEYLFDLSHMFGIFKSREPTEEEFKDIKIKHYSFVYSWATQRADHLAKLGYSPTSYDFTNCNIDGKIPRWQKIANEEPLHTVEFGEPHQFDEIDLECSTANPTKSIAGFLRSLGVVAESGNITQEGNAGATTLETEEAMDIQLLDSDVERVSTEPLALQIEPRADDPSGRLMDVSFGFMGGETDESLDDGHNNIQSEHPGSQDGLNTNGYNSNKIEPWAYEYGSPRNTEGAITPEAALAALKGFGVEEETLLGIRYNLSLNGLISEPESDYIIGLREATPQSAIRFPEQKIVYLEIRSGKDHSLVATLATWLASEGPPLQTLIDMQSMANQLEDILDNFTDGTKL